MEVSWDRATPKSSILIACSIINYPFWGTPISGNLHYPIATQPRVLMCEDNLIHRAIIEKACDTWVEDKIGQGTYQKLVEFIGAPNNGNGLLPYSFHVQSHYLVWEGYGKMRSRQPKGPCKFHGKDIDFFTFDVFFSVVNGSCDFARSTPIRFSTCSSKLRGGCGSLPIVMLDLYQYSRQSTWKQTLAGSPSSIILQHMYGFVATYVSL